MRSKREKRIIRRRLVSTITALDIKNYYDAPIEEDDGTRYG